jgi:hypothetical protein
VEVSLKLESGGYWIEYAADVITVTGGYSRILNPTTAVFQFFCNMC